MTIDEGEDDEPVRASQCALAVVVPLTRADFRSELESEGEGNFAQSYLPRVTSASVKWAAYAPSATAIERLIGEAERLGVEVVRRARLGDFADLLRTHRVVTLVTHTRLFRAVAIADIKDVTGLRDTLVNPSNALREALRDRLAGPAPADADPEAWECSRSFLLRPKAVGAESELAIAGAVASALTALLREAEACFGQKRLRAELGLDPVRLRPWTRPVLEAELAGHLEPARMIQLADGMITTPALLAALPPEYSGVLDLSTCNSVFLSEAIKRASPRCTVVWNRMLARLLPCVQRYVFILRVLERGATSPREKGTSSYVDAFLRVTAALRDP